MSSNRMERVFKVTEGQLNQILLTACETTLQTGLMPAEEGMSQKMLDFLCEVGLLTENWIAHLEGDVQ